MLKDFSYEIDPLGSLLYWDCLEKCPKILNPGEVIEDHYLGVGKVGQQNLLPSHFTLKPKDLEFTQIHTEEGTPIGPLIPPGASGFVFFGSKEAKQDSLEVVAQSHLGRDVSKKNRLYVSMVGDVIKAGWLPFFAPLIDNSFPVRNPLHLIMVPQSLVGTRNLVDATEQEKINLANSFVRWQEV